MLQISYLRSTVRVGEHNLLSDIDCNGFGICAPKPQDIPVKSVTHHNDYNNPSFFSNDIAIIELENPVVENGNSLCQLKMDF